MAHSTQDQTDFDPQAVLDFWFPDNGHWTSAETHAAFWDERMQGGMDAAIIADFADLTLAAATGQLDHWAETPRGRLALLIALDQFPRSLWRDTPAAFAQDIKATRLAEAGIANGDFDGLAPWEQVFFHIAISHCEGPDHLERMIRHGETVERIVAGLPAQMAAMGDKLRGQHQTILGVIKRFGRHPHRNAVLGRASSSAKADYIATGAFPHLRRLASKPSA
ncbi:MAG: DUF924 family protein [Pseudorhodobacter sp.]